MRSPLRQSSPYISSKKTKKLEALVVFPYPQFQSCFLASLLKKVNAGGRGGPEKGIFVSINSFATIYGKDCSIANLVYELFHELSNEVRLRILENKEFLRKLFTLGGDIA